MRRHLRCAASIRLGAFGIPYSPTEARIGTKRILLLGTNNYLGLSFFTRMPQKAHEAIDQGQVQQVHMANGNYSGHRALR